MFFPQETKWLKKPDGIWKKVPVETSFSSGLSRTTCPTSSSSRSSAPDAARGPVPAKQLIVDSSWNIPVLVTGSSSGESQVSPVVGNNVGFTNSFFARGIHLIHYYHYYFYCYYLFFMLGLQQKLHNLL